MQSDQKKPIVQRPTSGNDRTSLELSDRKADVPKVDDLLDEINKLLQRTSPTKKCVC